MLIADNCLQYSDFCMSIVWYKSRNPQRRTSWKPVGTSWKPGLRTSFQLVSN